MQQATGKLLSSMRRSLGQALELLAPHLPVIERDWSTLMQSLCIRPSDIKVLRGLTLAAHAKQLRSANFGAYQRAI